MRIFIGSVLAGLLGFLALPHPLSSLSVSSEREEKEEVQSISDYLIEKRAQVISSSFGIEKSEAEVYVYTAYKVALELDADVDSILALVAVETGFRNLISPKKALGHTQIRMKYWAHLFPREEEVWNPYYSYRAAVLILREYRGSLRRYSGGAREYEKRFQYWYQRFKEAL